MKELPNPSVEHSVGGASGIGRVRPGIGRGRTLQKTSLVLGGEVVILMESELGSSTSEVVAAITKQPPAVDDTTTGLACRRTWSTGGRSSRRLRPRQTRTKYIYIYIYIYTRTTSVGVGYRPTFTTTTRTCPSMGDLRSAFDRGTVGRWWWPGFRSGRRSGYRRGRKTDVFVQA